MRILQKDLPLALVLMIPLWALGGIAWGTAMAFLMDGVLVEYLIAGLLWGAGCWLLMTPLLIYLTRATTVILEMDADDAEERLEEVIPKVGFAVETRSDDRIICRPSSSWSWEYPKVEIVFEDGKVILRGTAVAVNAFKKKLLS